MNHPVEIEMVSENPVIGEYSNLVCDPPAAWEMERAGIHQELFEAARVQRSLMGSSQLRAFGYDLACEIFPVRYVSGDFVTSFDLEESTLFAIGDIAGKGMAAGMWFAHIVSLVRAHGSTLHEPEKVMQAVNRHLCHSSLPNQPITSMFVARLDWHTHQLTYCNAGHPSPLLLRGESDCDALTIGGPVLGALPDAQFQQAEIPLGANDLLLCYSDGLIECPNARDEEYGIERLMRHVCANRDARASHVVFSLLGALQDFAAGAPRYDDFSLLALRRLGDSC